MFDVDEFIAESRACLSESEPRLAVRELLERTVASGEDVEARLPATRAELRTLHHAADLTVLQVVWAPGMSIWPHDHRMWAAIAIYRGKEDNSFFRRRDRRIVPAGGKEVGTGEVLLLGDDVIHAVHNPLGVCSGALHVYGGDFFGREMSQWHPDTFQEEDEITPPARFFEEANARLGL